jgi:hypothetical protein
MTEVNVLLGGKVGSALQAVLDCDAIEPGHQPGYTTCKQIFLFHPLGAKMAEAPVTMAQSQARIVTVQDAPTEVLDAFLEEHENMGVDDYEHNLRTLSRVYGISSVALGCEGKSSEKPLDMWKLWDEKIFFNVLDPLNTAGSLILSQIPNSSDFQKPTQLATNGSSFHRSRFQVVMNEQPIFIEYQQAGFGYVGRSVYQRALYPLKSFINSMVADDMIQSKLGVLIAMMEQPGSIIDNMMEKVFGIKRVKLKTAVTGNVLGIGKDESIETLNMQNVDGAGTYSRTNILKNCATAGDMPAKLLENETMIGGMAEGTEDAKTIARYVGGERKKMTPQYRWFDNVTQYRAWCNPDFYARLQRQYPRSYGKRDIKDAFAIWRRAFKAEWPSFLIEPESEAVKTEDTKLKAIVSVIQVLLPELDPENKAALIEWAQDNIGENKRMFPHGLQLDLKGLEDFQMQQQERQTEMEEQGGAFGQGGGNGGASNKGQKLGPPKIQKLGRG